MRFASLLLALSLSLVSGCSIMIASCGKDVTALKTREEVHVLFGAPAASGVEDGRLYEDFYTRMKIATRPCCDGEGYAFLLVWTCGAAELVTTPCELYRLCIRTVLGQTIRVSYDRAGKPYATSRDGDSLRLLEGQPADDPIPAQAEDPGRAKHGTGQ
jgi:hypothetical protein